MSFVIVEDLLQRLVAGVMVGAIYGLLCAGLGMIFGVIRIINFAQGEFMTLGMYAALFLAAAMAALVGFGSVGDTYAAIAVAAIGLAVVGWFTQKYIIAFVSGTRMANSDNQGHFAQLI